jgi:heptose I phosphotransferase
MKITLNKKLDVDLRNNKSFKQIMRMQGEIFRAVKNRQTIKFELNNHSYFIKKHFGIGLIEIIKTLLKLRVPIISATNEVRAIECLAKQNLLTPQIVGFGIKGINPANKQSFIITEEIKNITGLRDIAINWQKAPPSFALKNALIHEVARITHIMHNAGINHRDLYLAHFLLKLEALNALNQNKLQNLRNQIYIFDPHRAQQRKKIPLRWIIKDLSSLYFSCLDIPLSKKDIFRFLKIYYKTNLRFIFKQHSTTLSKIEQKAYKLRRTKTA